MSEQNYFDRDPVYNKHAVTFAVRPNDKTTGGYNLLDVNLPGDASTPMPLLPWQKYSLPELNWLIWQVYFECQNAENTKRLLYGGSGVEFAIMSEDNPREVASYVNLSNRVEYARLVASFTKDGVIRILKDEKTNKYRLENELGPQVPPVGNDKWEKRCELLAEEIAANEANSRSAKPIGGGGGGQERRNSNVWWATSVEGGSS